MSDTISLGLINPSPRAEAERPERRDAAENRARILAAARQLFAERGVAAVNMADIAEAAGVGKGTLYRRFADKGELCYALMDVHLAGFQEAQLAILRQQSEAGVAPLEQLVTFLDALVHFTDEHSPLLCEVQRSGRLAEFGVTGMPHYWQRLTIFGLLQLAINAGEIPDDLDIEYIADVLLAPLNAHFFRFQRVQRGFSLARISAGLRSLVEGLSCL